MFDYRQYMGTPFVQHGRARDGFDCWGLVRLAYHDWYGIALPEFAGYDFDVNNPLASARLMAEGARLDIWRTVDEPQFGNILLFGNGPAPYHVGVYLTPELMLHTRAGTDCTTERHSGLLWGGRKWAVFTHRDLL